MEESVFIRYDETFIRRYKELGTLIEEGDKAKLHRFLLRSRCKLLLQRLKAESLQLLPSSNSS